VVICAFSALKELNANNIAKILVRMS